MQIICQMKWQLDLGEWAEDQFSIMIIYAKMNTQQRTLDKWTPNKELNIEHSKEKKQTY